MSLLYQAKTFVTHWLLEVDEHSIHSPFFFDFYNKVLKAPAPNSEFSKLEKLRTDLLSNTSAIDADDFGGRNVKSGKKTLAEIALREFMPEHYCALFYRIARHLKAKRIVELGTSFGLTTLYLAAHPESQVYTFEGSHNIANIAITNFEYFENRNIQLIEGNIDSTLSNFLQETAKVNFALIDANYNYESVLKHFNLLMKRTNEKSIVVVNNIHYSRDMDKAWQWLKSNELVYGTIDLHKCGILFFEPSLNKQHFIFSLPKK